MAALTVGGIILGEREYPRKFHISRKPIPLVSLRWPISQRLRTGNNAFTR